MFDLVAVHAPALEFWVIYDHPQDIPAAAFVARSWAMLPEPLGAVPTSRYITADTLEAARRAIPEGLTCIPRDTGDDPVIVETWVPPEWAKSKQRAGQT